VKRVAVNDNLPRAGDPVALMDPELAVAVAQYLRTSEFKVAGLRGDCVTLVAATDYDPLMPVPTTVQAALDAKVRYFGVRLQRVRVTRP
jgi:hypothetical protein